MDYNSYNDPYSNPAGGGMMGVIWLVIAILVIVALWKIFVKAGKPGWASLIPFYNIYVLLKIVGKPGWWLIWYFIPIANIIVSIIVSVRLAHAFKRSTVFGVVLLWLFSLVGYLILGFGKSTYTALSDAKAPASPSTPAS